VILRKNILLVDFYDEKMMCNANVEKKLLPHTVGGKNSTARHSYG